MKALPLLLLPFLIAPVSAESIGDRSNRQAYADAPSRNWFDNIFGPPSSSVAHEYREVRREPAPINPWWRASNSYQPGYSSSSTCTRQEYREEYVPGTANRPGYVNSWHDTIWSRHFFASYMSLQNSLFFSNWI